MEKCLLIQRCKLDVRCFKFDENEIEILLLSLAYNVQFK